MHRRAAQALRERERADRRAPDAAGVVASRRAATLKGVHLTFTGILRTRRSEAAAAARRAGAIVHSGPSSQTTVVVRGRPNPLQAAGRDGGLKLMEIKRLREKGHRITLLNEEQFWRLVGVSESEGRHARCCCRRSRAHHGSARRVFRYVAAGARAAVVGQRVARTLCERVV